MRFINVWEFNKLARRLKSGATQTFVRLRGLTQTHLRGFFYVAATSSRQVLLLHPLENHPVEKAIAFFTSN